MRPRQKADGDAAKAQHHRQKCRNHVDAFADMKTHHGCRQSGAGSEHKMDARPTPQGPGQRHQDLGQPFLGVPGRAGNSVGEDIRAQHGMVRQHPFPGTDVPIGVAVIQQAGRESRQRKPRQPRKQGKGHGWGKGARHRIGFRIAGHSIRAILMRPFRPNTLVFHEK